jgi:hypothetical protein
MPAGDPRQLTLDDRLGAPGPVAVEPVGRPPPPFTRTRVALGTRAVLISFLPVRDGARVRLEAEHDAPGAWAIGIELRLRPILFSTVESDAPDRLHWALAGAAGRDAREFFGYAVGWTVRKLAGATLARGRLLRVEEAVRPVLDRAAAGLAARLEPGVRKEALRFAPAVRARVAAALARDRRGWLAQAAHARPGLLLLALGLLDADETEHAGGALLHALGEGARLGPALDVALAAWAAALPAWRDRAALWPRPLRGAFAAAAERAGDDRTALLAAQKVLVRRAGPRCDPSLLLVPPPLRFAPEDVPASPAANAAWFTVMKVPGVTVDGRPRTAPPALLEAFSAFASRHAPALVRRRPRLVPVERWLAEVLETFRAAGRTPSRATDPARAVAGVDRDALRRPLPPPPPLAPLPAVALEARPVPATDDAGAVSLCPRLFEPWSAAGVTVTQITTVRALREEGARVHNCVASYRPRIARGDLVVFSAVVHGQPVTISVAPWMGGWRVQECKGFANRRLLPAEDAALAPWRDANGIAPFTARPRTRGAPR